MTQQTRQSIAVAAERAVLVGVDLPGEFVDDRDRFGELRALAETAGATVVGELAQKRRVPSGRYYLGKGKLDELRQIVAMTDAGLVIFDNDLSPAQIRALERELERKIIDRSELILDIFANRAATAAAKLQVEIAQLEYTYPRLRAMWTHLGQVTGGAPIGIGTRGPGEKQIEIDRRIVQQRLAHLRRELATIQARKTREVAARNVDHFTVGLVGYTNAGKSTLFNTLTAGGAYAHAKLFATLSTRTERWDLGGGNGVMLSDTVGFIRNLPHHLVASFRSTLEETVFAHVLLLVVDVGDPNAPMQLETVQNTLDDIGATTQPRLVVLNKIDQLERTEDLLVWLNRIPEALAVSARTGEGLEALRERVLEVFLGPVREVVVEAPLADSRTIDFLEKRTTVLDREYADSRARLRVRMGRRQVNLLLSRGARVSIDGVPLARAIGEVWPSELPPPPPKPIAPHRLAMWSDES